MRRGLWVKMKWAFRSWTGGASKRSDGLATLAGPRGQMKSGSSAGRLWLNRHVWRITAMMLFCGLYYYLDVISGLIGWTSVEDVLGKLHDFHGLVFFAPVVYAAYVFGLRGALVAAFVAMVVLLPYALCMTPYSDALYRPTAFAVILSAVGAAVAMLQKSDEQSRKSMNELKCLYELGRAAEGSSSLQQFLSVVVDLVPRAIRHSGAVGVRIAVRDNLSESPGFDESCSAMREDLVAAGNTLGTLEICCTGKPHSLDAHHTLIRTFAEGIGGAVRRLELEHSLKVYSEQLEAMVDARTRDLKHAHEQLRLLSNTVKSSIDGITLTDMDGNLTFANEATQRMWGYSHDELMRMKLSHLYTPSQLRLVEEEIVPGSRAGIWRGELDASKKDGRRFPVVVTTSPVYDEKGQTVAIVGVHRDVTETKNMRDQLIRSERLAAVGQLASGVGHELRNPLNVIRNCVYLLNMTLGDDADAEMEDTLKLLDQQVDISNKIVTDLLNFTRIRPPNLAKVDLNSLVKESLSWVVIPEDIAVMSEVDDDSLPVNADAEQVGRAFANIIANAVQSMNKGGKLKIDTGTEDGYAWARFEDTGCGIPEENLEKIFQPLFTTKPRGIGLGLAITKGLIEQNGGAIEVSSQPEKGTTFIVRLPAFKQGGKSG